MTRRTSTKLTDIELERVTTAAGLGGEAFTAGRISVPALDPALSPLLAGVSPKGAIAILDAWSSAWHAANLAEPIETAVTDEQIEALLVLSKAAGDDPMVEVCRKALGRHGAVNMTCAEARAECATFAARL